MRWTLKIIISVALYRNHVILVRNHPSEDVISKYMKLEGDIY